MMYQLAILLSVHHSSGQGHQRAVRSCPHLVTRYLSQWLRIQLVSSPYGHLAIPTMYGRGVITGVIPAQSRDELLHNLFCWALRGLEPFRPV